MLENYEVRTNVYLVSQFLRRYDRNVLNSGPRKRNCELKKPRKLIDKQRAVKMKNAKLVKCFSGSIKSHLNQVFSYSNNRNCFCVRLVIMRRNRSLRIEYSISKVIGSKLNYRTVCSLYLQFNTLKV